MSEISICSYCFREVKEEDKWIITMGTPAGEVPANAEYTCPCGAELYISYIGHHISHFYWRKD